MQTNTSYIVIEQMLKLKHQSQVQCCFCSHDLRLHVLKEHLSAMILLAFSDAVIEYFRMSHLKRKEVHFDLVFWSLRKSRKGSYAWSGSCALNVEGQAVIKRGKTQKGSLAFLQPSLI